MLGWHTLDNETRAAIISACATLLAALAGFGAVVLSIQSQGTQSRAAIVEKERRKLKDKMYEDAVLICRSVADTAIYLSNMLRTMIAHLEIGSQAQVAGMSFPIPPTRFPKLLASYASFSAETLRFIFLVENRLIIDPRLIVFRTAFNTVLHDTRDLMYSKFPLHVMPTLPTDGANGSLLPYNAPTVEDAATVTGFAEQFIDSLTDGIMYTEDFIVEMQNLLLGDLFGTRLSRRQPVDPSKKVIRLDQADSLEAWFRRETPWGKEWQQVEADTRARFTATPAIPS